MPPRSSARAPPAATRQPGPRLVVWPTPTTGPSPEMSPDIPAPFPSCFSFSLVSHLPSLSQEPLLWPISMESHRSYKPQAARRHHGIRRTWPLLRFGILGPRFTPPMPSSKHLRPCSRILGPPPPATSSLCRSPDPPFCSIPPLAGVPVSPSLTASPLSPCSSAKSLESPPCFMPWTAIDGRLCQAPPPWSGTTSCPDSSSPVSRRLLQATVALLSSLPLASAMARMQAPTSIDYAVNSSKRVSTLPLSG